MGYNSYEVRGTEVYATISDDFDYGVPVFEIRGSDVYPTLYNDRDDQGFPAFTISDGYAYPTYLNNNDDIGFDVPGDHDTDHGSGASASSGPDATFGELAVVAAIGLGIAAAATRRSRAKERRAQAASHALHASLAPPPPAQLAPPAAGPTTAPAAGWYPTGAGFRFWSGSTWTEHVHPAPAHPYLVHPYPAHPGRHPVPTIVVAAPSNGATVALAWIVTMLTVGYMLPWAIAVTRRSSNGAATGVVCLLLGWTVIGWVVALIMACTGTTRPSAFLRYGP